MSGLEVSPAAVGVLAAGFLGGAVVSAIKWGPLPCVVCLLGVVAAAILGELRAVRSALEDEED